MRISGGEARGIRLKVPKGVRPASEKVRQAIFSSIAARVTGASVLDLFAGSGAYGLEALSRGATRATFVDSSPDAVAVIRENAKAAGLDAGVAVKRSPAERFVERTADAFDLVFIDPPYDAPFDRLLGAVARVLSPSGSIVCERRWRDEPAPAADGLVVEADRRYGDTRVVLLSRGTTEGIDQ